MISCAIWGPYYISLVRVIDFYRSIILKIHFLILRNQCKAYQGSIKVSWKFYITR